MTPAPHPDLTPDRAALFAALATPPGLPGSGRQRYGAAMALNRAGAISDAVLEVYRICSPLDAEDPAGLLAARGLPMPAAPAPVAADTLAAGAILALIDEADLYLSRFATPGIAETRARIAEARDARLNLRPRAPNAVAGRWLTPALELLAPQEPALAAAIRAAGPWLNWVTYDRYSPDIGPDFAQGNAVASLAGVYGPVDVPDFDLGLFLVAPHVLYRDHAHPAPELYAPLTGPHGWRFGPGTPLQIRPAHQPLWNPPNHPHLTKVGPMPFLALYAWTQDIAGQPCVLPADDWPGLEALRLG